MSLPREQVLKELGIAPVWRLKETATAGAEAGGDVSPDRSNRILAADGTILHPNYILVDPYTFFALLKIALQEP